METNVADERLQFVRDFKSGHWSMTELCERYGVTRPTGYKWVARHRADGDRGLVERSWAPHTCPHRTNDDVEAFIHELSNVFLGLFRSTAGLTTIGVDR